MKKNKISISVALLVCFVWVIGTNESSSQESDISRYIHERLQDIPAKTPEVQTYAITVKRQGTDPVDGTILFADAAKGTYCVLNGDSIRWSHVSTMAHREPAPGTFRRKTAPVPGKPGVSPVRFLS